MAKKTTLKKQETATAETAEQAVKTNTTAYELKALKRKAEKGLKRIGKGTRGYDLKMKDLIAGYENVRHGDYLDTLRIMYYSGIESGFRMAEKQQQKQSS